MRLCFCSLMLPDTGLIFIRGDFFSYMGFMSVCPSFEVEYMLFLIFMAPTPIDRPIVLLRSCEFKEASRPRSVDGDALLFVCCVNAVVL